MKYDTMNAYSEVLRSLAKGVMPTVRDIAEALGTTSTSTASAYINKMADDRLVTVVGGGQKMYIWPKGMLEVVSDMANAALDARGYTVPSPTLISVRIYRGELPVICGARGLFTVSELLEMEDEIRDVYPIVMPDGLASIFKGDGWHVIAMTLKASRYNDLAVDSHWFFECVDYRVT